MSSEVDVKVPNLPVDWMETAKGLTAGAAGGITQVLIGKRTIYPKRWHLLTSHS